MLCAGHRAEWEEKQVLNAVHRRRHRHRSGKGQGGGQQTGRVEHSVSDSIPSLSKHKPTAILH